MYEQDTTLSEGSVLAIGAMLSSLGVLCVIAFFLLQKHGQIIKISYQFGVGGLLLLHGIIYDLSDAK